MPATIVPITGRREGVYALLEACLPGHPPHNIGVLLIDPSADRGWVRFRRRFDDIASPEDAEVLSALEEDFRDGIARTGGDAWLRSLEDALFQRPARRGAPGGAPWTPSPACSTASSAGMWSKSPSSRSGPRAALQPARRGRVLGEEMEPGSGRLGARARGHAARPRTSSWRTWWAAPWSRAFPMAASTCSACTPRARARTRSCSSSASA